MQRKLAQLDTEQYWSIVLGNAPKDALVQDLKNVMFRLRADNEIANQIRKELHRRELNK